MEPFAEALRRIVTGDDAQGKSLIILDGGPSSTFGAADLGGLFEIWEDKASGPLDPRVRDDLGMNPPKLGPAAGNVQVRWFVVAPLPEAPREALNAQVRETFAAFGGAEHIVDQSRHPAMHTTHTLDVICLLQGDVSLILDGAETRLKPSQVVIQRGTNHAWKAHGGPALLLAVLIDRPLTNK
ncbi:MAG: cupin domain-containing protein [Hyphomonadaceae bacterium]